MDVKKIGIFLSQLRKERGMTQEQLGEKLGVTNKTVSRWENGNYLPPVEMLQMLSGLYGITINEILSGEMLSDTRYREKAEENIQAALRESAFTLKEKIGYFSEKWSKEHRVSNILGWVIILTILLVGWYLDNGLTLIGILSGFAFHIIRYNQKAAYVESHAFDGSGNR